MQIAGGFDFLSFEHRWRPMTLNQQCTGEKRRLTAPRL